MGTMLDTTSDPRHAFSGLTVEAVAAYANGSYANYRQAKAEFPHVHVLEIDVTGQGVGNTGDFEAKDMPYSRAGSWAKSRINAGIHRPVLYFSVSNWRAIMQSLKASGLTRNSVRIWTAHYTGTPHLCSSACGYGVTGSADATQWGSADYPKTLHPPYTGHHLDVSITAEGFFGGATTPPPPFPGRNLHQPPAMKGDDVHKWQARMSERGWNITVNGVYDAASAHVCKQFQAEKRLTVNGIVDVTTWRSTWTAPVT